MDVSSYSFSLPKSRTIYSREISEPFAACDSFLLTSLKNFETLVSLVFVSYTIYCFDHHLSHGKKLDGKTSVRYLIYLLSRCMHVWFLKGRSCILYITIIKTIIKTNIWDRIELG